MKLSGDATDQAGSAVPITLGKLKKFNYFDTYQEDSTPIEEALTTSFSGSTCDNFVLEYHLKIKFKTISEEG